MSAIPGTAFRSLLAAVALGLVCAGCTSSGTPVDAPTPSPTPLARLNTAAMALPRIDFCGLVSHAAVSRALAEATGTPSRWANGGRTVVPGLGRQVVAEHGCGWTAGPAAARAWTYAPPVTPALARSVVAQSGAQPHCHDVAGPAFGLPSLTQVCTQGAAHRVRHAGLFGDTWLSCEVSDSAPVAVVRKRADAWCVEVANTLNMTR